KKDCLAVDSKIDNEDKLDDNNKVLKNEQYIENNKDLGEIKRKCTNLKRNLNTDLMSSNNLKKKMKKDNGYSFLHLNIYKNNNTYEFCRNNSYNTYILKTVGNSYLKHKINEKKKKMKSTIINTINANNTNNTENIPNKKPCDNMHIHMYGSKDKMFYHDQEETVHNNNNIEDESIKENKNELIETKNYINDKELSKGTKFVMHKENVCTHIGNNISHDYILNDHISSDNISKEYIPYECFTNNEDVNSSNCLNKSESLNSQSSTNSAHINNMNSSGENETNYISVFNDKTVDLLHLNLHDVVRMLENENIETLYTPEELKEILIPISGVYYSSSDEKWIYQYNNDDDNNNNNNNNNNIVDNNNNIDGDNNNNNNIGDNNNNIGDNNNNIDGVCKELNKMTSSEQTKHKSDNEKNISLNNKYSFHEGRQLALMLKYKYIKRNHTIFKNLNDQEMFFSDINDHTNKEIYNDGNDLYDNTDNEEEHMMGSQSNKYELENDEIHKMTCEQINNMNNEENIKRNEQKEMLKDENDKLKKRRLLNNIHNNDINLVQKIECDEKIHFCDKEKEENNLSNNKLGELHLNTTGHILKNEIISYNTHINSSHNINDIKDSMKQNIHATNDTCNCNILNNPINNNKTENVPNYYEDVKNFNSGDDIIMKTKTNMWMVVLFLII
ncbi:hypothetical protein PFLG_02584, partial [Plasmodium falciparum RAJ116]